MKQRRWINLFSASLISLLLPLTTFACSQGNYLVGRGSNSISPIINLVNKNTLFNSIYSPDGSTFGAREMARPKVEIDFGAASSRRAPGTLYDVPGIDYSDPQAGLDQEVINWNNNKIRTLTFAIDAIAIGINLPLEIKTKLGPVKPTIDFDALAKMYCLPFNDVRFPKWKDLLTNDIADLPVAQTNPIALAIEGGVSTSGKSEAFIDKILTTSQWVLDNDTELRPHFPAIRDHDYIAPEYKVADRDQEIYTKNNSVNGSIIYYSLGYLLKNTGQAKVTISNIFQTNVDWDTPTIAHAQEYKYPWTRPFNIMYSVMNQELVDLVKIMLQLEFQILIAQIGFVPLTLGQIKIQSQTHSVTEIDQQINLDTTYFDYGLKLNTIPPSTTLEMSLNV